MKANQYSVLMSVYWKEKPSYLKDAIQCMLNQTIKPSEFVIVEDGKLTAELNNVISDYCNNYPNIFKIVKLRQNVGLGLALNRGITECSNELIARMDSDDYATQNRVEKQIKILSKNPDLGMIGTNVEEFEGNTKNIVSHVILPETHEEIVRFSKARCPFRHPSLLYKKSAVLKAGNYRDFKNCQDYELYIRMISTGCKCYNIQEPMTYMRISKDFYKRRGGIKYLRIVLKLKNEQLRTGYFTFGEYIHSTIPHILVCLMPNTIRDYIYRNLLRKKPTNR